MDPFSTVVGTLQIAGQCMVATKVLAKYINEVATVDQRITSFCEDVAKLKTTYETLQQCRNSPQMIAAAKATDEFTENLWAHLATTLKDCENTLVSINHILAKINKPLGLSAHLRQFVERPIKQLQEQLHSGELGRFHEKIRMFNTSLALPMQMINITLQLNQRELSEEHQQRLEHRLISMQRTIHSLQANIAGLRQPTTLRRSSTAGSSTLVDGTDNERMICEHMETFANRATQFLSNASSKAGSKSGASTVPADRPVLFGALSEAGMPLTSKERTRIRNWVPTLQDDLHTSPTQTELTPSPENELVDDSDDEDFECEMARKFFEHGQVYLAKEDYVRAEDNFSEALEVLSNNDFGERLAFQSADVTLLLAHCYVQQSNFDRAVELLLPLTETTVNSDASSVGSPLLDRSGRIPDRGRVLAAHHSLGDVYLKKQDLDNAETHGLLAFKGRRRLLGADHEKTIESVQLVVDIYTAKGKHAKAEAYSTHLVPDTRRISDRIRRPSARSTQAPGPSLQHAVAIQPPMIVPSAAPSPPLHGFGMQALSNDLPLTLTDSNRASIASPTVFDDDKTESSIAGSSVRRPGTILPRDYLKPRFDAVKTAALTSKDKACSAAHHVLKGYDPEPSRIIIQRWDDIRKNIRKFGSQKGLAATGLGYAPIHFFCELKHEAVTEVELLIEEGADLMAPRFRAGYGSQEPMTPLQLAIERNHWVIAPMILDALNNLGITMTQILLLRNRDDLSPFLAACRNGHLDLVRRFLELGATATQPFPRSWTGNSLLHDVASRCDTDMAMLLLSARTESGLPRDDIGTLEQQDQFGKTPLMYAVILENIADQQARDRKLRGRLSCVEALLKSAQATGVLDAQLNLRDHAGRSFWYFAEQQNDTLLTELLTRYYGGVEGALDL